MSGTAHISLTWITFLVYLCHELYYISQSSHTFIYLGHLVFLAKECLRQKALRLTVIMANVELLC